MIFISKNVLRFFQFFIQFLLIFQGIVELFDLLIFGNLINAFSKLKDLSLMKNF